MVNSAYREAIQREKNAEKYSSKQEVDELRKEKGGILKNKYPNAGPEKWKAKCEEQFCGFDYYLNDNKVDRVICPECNRELQIDPTGL